MEKEEEKETIEMPNGQMIRPSIIIPECCRENWPTCPHVPKRDRQRKKNIGL